MKHLVAVLAQHRRRPHWSGTLPIDKERWVDAPDLTLKRVLRLIERAEMANLRVIDDVWNRVDRGVWHVLSLEPLRPFGTGPCGKDLVEFAPQQRIIRNPLLAGVEARIGADVGALQR